uniref:Uncharacterized protein n=1 Tax=Anguilla anguilla TaxID=7936 RepID=A0A0E9UUA8_ANGAN
MSFVSLVVSYFS